MTQPLLQISGLRVRIAGREVLRGIDLEVGAGEVHAVMGPNGSGKSTLAMVLAGRDGYELIAGSVRFRNKDLLALTPEQRATDGLFLAFQYPVEIPGVSNLSFLRAALNAQRRARGEEELDALDFVRISNTKLKQLNLDARFGERGVNEGFSGGEKKRNEVFQMAVLEPTFAVLDETDSGLDIDALKVVAQGINALRSPERGMLLITHYPRLLEHVAPDRVHVLVDGQVVRSGPSGLAHELEREGYAGLEAETRA